MPFAQQCIQIHLQVWGADFAPSPFHWSSTFKLSLKCGHSFWVYNFVWLTETRLDTSTENELTNKVLSLEYLAKHSYEPKGKRFKSQF